MEVQATDGSIQLLIGERYETEEIPVSRLNESGVFLEDYDSPVLQRYLIKVGNREYVPLDFSWVLEPPL